MTLTFESVSKFFVANVYNVERRHLQCRDAVLLSTCRDARNANEIEYEPNEAYLSTIFVVDKLLRPPIDY